MNTLKWVLLSICLLKIITLFLCFKSNQDNKEIARFIEIERVRKFNDHSIAHESIRGTSPEYKEISQDSIRYLLGDSNDEDLPLLNPTGFWRYARYLRTLDKSWQSPTEISLKSFPQLLQNAVSEENAKREIYQHFDHMEKVDDRYNPIIARGMVTDISTSIDSLYLNLVPFRFHPKLELGKYQCGAKIIESELNPFYYTGSFLNCKCTFKNKVTGEVYTYDLQTIE